MRKVKCSYKLLPVFILMMAGNAAFSQFYSETQMSFGKNRIQYKEFLWTYYKFEDFDTYFYLNGQELAVAVAKYATEQLPVMERRLQSSLDQKIQFLVFNNLTDLKQSNIGLVSEQRYNTGGITHIIGSKVFLYFDGNHRNFERQIRAGIANVLVNQLIYGTSIGSQIKNNTLINLPEWYTNGLISYLSEPWNPEIDTRVRDGILNERFNKFNHLTGEDALYAGHSLWAYIGDTYGDLAVTEIINMTRLSRNVENGFLYVIGVSFKNLVKDWLAYYKNIYEAENENLVEPEGQVLRRVKKDLVYNRFRVGPDGRHAVYSTNDEGRFKIYLMDLATGKRKKIFNAGFRLEEKVDYSYPLMAWHPGGRLLAFILEKKGEVYLYFYNLQEKSYQKVILYNFEKVLAFDYSPDGRSLIFSAVQHGWSDLYLYNIAAGSHQQLTNDIYDDLEPVFFGEGNKVLFASNRAEERYTPSNDEIPFSVPSFTDLFLLNLSDSRNMLRRVTSTPYANESKPLDAGGDYFLYLNDESGIINRYLGRYDSAISFIDTTVHYRFFTETYPITNYSRNIIDHAYSSSSGRLGQVIYNKGKYLLQMTDLPEPGKTGSLNPTKTTFKNAEIERKKAEEKADHVESLKLSAGGYNKGFKNAYRPAGKAATAVPLELTPQEQSEIDINNYIFDPKAFISLTPADSTISDSTAASVKELEPKDRFTIPKRLNYRVEYSINELATQLDFTSLNYFYEPFGGGFNGFNNLGLNGFFQVGITDLLEDHRMVGGFRIPVNFNNVDYLFSYSNLKRRIDKEIVFVRQAIEDEFFDGFYTFIARYRSYQLYYILKYPFSPVFAVRGTANVRYQKGTWLSTNEIGLREPDSEEYWGGVKGELIFDNTKQLGLNLYHGMRFKIFAEYTQVLGSENKNLTVLGIDFRHYQKIHRSFIWANRLAASTSFGKNHLAYFMGGVDNWLTPRFEGGTPIDYSMNYAYQALATNMRGFNQNIRNGNNFIVINSELRFPVFRYFMNKPIKSQFINNFQVVGFGDVGTAWAGPDPYSEENSFYIRYIQDGSLLIKVREMKEPLVGGFGFGARTKLLGYFIRGDVAWGVEDRKIRKPIFYFSFSLDF